MGSDSAAEAPARDREDEKATAAGLNGWLLLDAPLGTGRFGE
jgi:hypothetical protein